MSLYIGIAGACGPIEKNLVFSQDVVCIYLPLPPVVSNLTLTQTVKINLHYTNPSHLLILSQEATYAAITYVIGMQFINFSHTVDFARPVSRSATSVLQLTDAPEANIKAGVAFSELYFQQTTDSAIPKILTASNHFVNSYDIDDILASVVGLRNSVTVEIVCNLAVTSYLSPSHSLTLALEATASNHLHLSSTTRTIEYETPSDILILTHATTAYVPDSVSNDIVFAQSVALASVKSEALESTVDFISAANAFIPDVDPVLPVLVATNDTVFTYGSISVTLPNPEFDNVEQLETRRINRRSRGGTLQIYRDDAWPITERKIMTFNHLTDTQARDILHFLEVSVGQEIGLTDHENRYWTGLILTPTTAITKRSAAGSSIMLEMEV